MAPTIKLPPDITERIHLFVAEGDYPDAESAMREAVKLLEDHHEYQRLRESIIAADRDIDAGHGIPWNDETKTRLWIEGLQLAESGDALEKDVWPD